MANERHLPADHGLGNDVLMERVAAILIFIAVAWGGIAMASGTPLPTSSDVQRVTPTRCPTTSIPVVNSQGTLLAPLSLTTAAKVIPGNGARQIYSFLFSLDTNCAYGTSLDGAPAIAPDTSHGMLYKANTLYWEDVYPANRMDCASVSGGADLAYTTECVP